MSNSWLLNIKRYYWAFRKDPASAIYLKNLQKFYTCSIQILGYGLQGKTNFGWCPICEKETTFIRKAPWLRDHYLCAKCRSIPRFRALIHILQKYFPDYKNLTIHESSPSGPGANKLKKQCSKYTYSFYFPDTMPGNYKENIRCENLENLTFADHSFDLFVTQDVFEHVMNPDKAFAEIARVLRPNGAHVFTVPQYQKETFIRAKQTTKGILHIAPKEYHGDPINERGSLVVTEWGVDLPEYIFRHSGLYTTVYLTRDPKLGLDGEFLEVFVSRKLTF